MILVVEKLFRILAHLRGDRETPLAELAEQTGVNKGTLCNLLRSLLELGFVERGAAGCYRLTEKFRRLGTPDAEHLATLAGNAVRELADNTRESGVAAVLEHGELRILAQHQFDRDLMVGPCFYRNLSLFHSVSGRIILAGLPTERLDALLEQTGPPGDRWPEGASRAALDGELARLRREKIAVMDNPAAGIKAFAVAFTDGAGTVRGSLGLTVPSVRLGGGNERFVVTALERAAKRLSEHIAHSQLKPEDFPPVN